MSKKVTFDLPEDVAMLFKIECLRVGHPQKLIIEALMRRWLEERKKLNNDLVENYGRQQQKDS